jgi:hypothetical protein
MKHDSCQFSLVTPEVAVPDHDVTVEGSGSDVCELVRVSLELQLVTEQPLGRPSFHFIFGFGFGLVSFIPGPFVERRKIDNVLV